MSVDSTDLQAWCDQAQAIARAAGQALVQHFESDLQVETKSNDIDLVTVADRASEAIILEGLRTHWPDHAVLAEESGWQGDDTRPVWYVDPLDGTTNYAHGFPHFAVVMGLYLGGEGKLGVVFDPMRDEMFSAVASEGAWIASPRTGRRRLHVQAAERLRACLLATGFAYDRATSERNNLAQFQHVLPLVRGIRRPGSAALDMAYVAAGRFNGYWEFDLQPWDWGAGAVLIREAGGVVQTSTGATWRPGETSVVAGPAAVVERLAVELKQC